MLGVQQLTDLIKFSRSVGMEPLVEVHTDQEMEIALNAGAKVIGVNNRNLHNFQLDLDTTARILKVAEKRGVSWKLNSQEPEEKPDILVAALSGISTAADVAEFQRLGVSCCLIGETLMKSNDPRATLQQLLAGVDHSSPTKGLKPIVKTCGITNSEDAVTALQSGANLVGIIFAPSSRKVTMEAGKEIVSAVRKYGERDHAIDLKIVVEKILADNVKHPNIEFGNILRKITLRQPLTVGVFQDQPVEEVCTFIVVIISCVIVSNSC